MVFDTRTLGQVLEISEHLPLLDQLRLISRLSDRL